MGGWLGLQVLAEDMVGARALADHAEDFAEKAQRAFVQFWHACSKASYRSGRWCLSGTVWLHARQLSVQFPDCLDVKGNESPLEIEA